MQRKINRVGTGTLTVSLPKQWTDKHQLKKGDELDLAEDGSTLIIHPKKAIEKEKSITINLDNLDVHCLSKLLIACFEEGFTHLILKTSKPEITDLYFAKRVDLRTMLDRSLSRIIGFEIISQTAQKIEIGRISETSFNFESLLNRIFFLLDEFCMTLIDAVESKNTKPLFSEELRHDNVAKYIATTFRSLVTSKQYSSSEITNYSLVLNILDKVTDLFRYSYREYRDLSVDVSKEAKQLMQLTREYLSLYRQLCNKFSFETIQDMERIRPKVKKLYKTISLEFKDETLAASHINSIVEIVNGGVKPIMANILITSPETLS